MNFDLSSFFFSPFLFFFSSSFHHSFPHTNRLYIYNHALETSDQTPFENETCNDGTMTFRNTFCTSTYRDSSLKFACSMNNFARNSFLLMKQERKKKFGQKLWREIIVNECSNRKLSTWNSIKIFKLLATFKVLITDNDIPLRPLEFSTIKRHTVEILP